MNTLLTTHGIPSSLPDGATLLLTAPASVESSAHLHSSGCKLLYTVEEIHLRAETVTPLLREILDFRPPEHWGINE